MDNDKLENDNIENDNIENDIEKLENIDIEQNNPPITPYIHIGIIPDGNRRWCKKNNKDQFEYATMARNMIKNVLDDILHKNIFDTCLLVSEISIYLLSKDNLGRTDSTLDLIEKTIDFCKTLFSIQKYGEMCSLSIYGDVSLLPHIIQTQLAECKSYAKGTFPINIAIAYDPFEDSVLYLQHGLHTRRQIDLVIRSGGQLRSSGFFPLQTLYSEWVYLDELWPDMTQEHIHYSILEFLHRKRNFGK
jgi:undecaprenyl diphosphate synthase